MRVPTSLNSDTSRLAGLDSSRKLIGDSENTPPSSPTFKRKSINLLNGLQSPSSGSVERDGDIALPIAAKSPDGGGVVQKNSLDQFKYHPASAKAAFELLDFTEPVGVCARPSGAAEENYECFNAERGRLLENVRGPDGANKKFGSWLKTRGFEFASIDGKDNDCGIRALAVGVDPRLGFPENRGALKEIVDSVRADIEKTCGEEFAGKGKMLQLEGEVGMAALRALNAKFTERDSQVPINIAFGVAIAYPIEDGTATAFVSGNIYSAMQGEPTHYVSLGNFGEHYAPIVRSGYVSVQHGIPDSLLTEDGIATGANLPGYPKMEAAKKASAEAWRLISSNHRVCTWSNMAGWSAARGYLEDLQNNPVAPPPLDLKSQFDVWYDAEGKKNLSTADANNEDVQATLLKEFMDGWAHRYVSSVEKASTSRTEKVFQVIEAERDEISEHIAGNAPQRSKDVKTLTELKKRTLPELEKRASPELEERASPELEKRTLSEEEGRIFQIWF